MNSPEQRSEARVPVSFSGTLRIGDETAVACHIQNMCSRGFLIRAASDLPVGRMVQLTCQLYPDRAVECIVQVRHVNRECLGARVTEMSDAQWLEVINIDLGGVMRTFRASARHMAAGGAMVAVSSIAGGVYGWEQHAHYAAAKAGVPGLCRAVAMELAPRGIRCNAVIPGLIETPQSLDPVNSLGPEGLAQAARGIPLGRVGQAREIAALIRFLTSEEASYITGQSIIADGGLTVRWPS